MARRTALPARPRPTRFDQSVTTPAPEVETLMDELALFQQFKEELLPKLQEAIIGGKSAEDILEMSQKYAAARLGTIIATEADSGRALSAIKEVLDRTLGKAVERKQVDHRLGKLPEEQIDALLITALEETTSTGDDKE